jgi:hypothetical protein
MVEAVCYKLEVMDATLGTCWYGGTGQRSWLRHCIKLEVLKASQEHTVTRGARGSAVA